MNPTAQNALQTMDVFTLLGTTGSPEDREAFLTELQDAIWQEVAEEHLASQLSDQEMDEISRVMDDTSLSVEAKRNKLFEVLGQKVPDIEKILEDKTIQIKEDLLTERLEGMMVYYEEDEDAMRRLEEADDLLLSEKYAEAVAILNDLSKKV